MANFTQFQFIIFKIACSDLATDIIPVYRQVDRWVRLMAEGLLHRRYYLAQWARYDHGARQSTTLSARRNTASRPVEPPPPASLSHGCGAALRSPCVCLGLAGRDIHGGAGRSQSLSDHRECAPRPCVVCLAAPRDARQAAKPSAPALATRRVGG